MERVSASKLKLRQIKGMNKMIKQLFLDMDGTLLNSQGQVSAENAAVLKNSDIPVTLVSARAPMEMRDAIQALDLKTPQIAFNGGLVFQPQGDILTAHPLAQSTSKRLLQLLKAEFPQVSLSYYTADHWYTARIDRGIQAEMAINNWTPTLSAEISQQPIFKIMLIVFEPQVMLKLQATLQALQLTDVSIQQSGTLYLELTSDLAKKSAGIAQIKRRRHLKTAEMAAFGDGHNDLPMLQAVGTPIVMGNALPEIQAAGKFVTKTNDEAGVAYGVTHFIGPKLVL